MSMKVTLFRILEGVRPLYIGSLVYSVRYQNKFGLRAKLLSLKCFRHSLWLLIVVDNNLFGILLTMLMMNFVIFSMKLPQSNIYSEQ